MTATTDHGPALDRRSHGVSVPGAPMRATLSMRALSPTAVRSVQHVSDPLRSVLAGRPTFQSFDGSTDGRARMTGLCVAWGQSPFESGRHSKVPAMCSGYVGTLKPRSRYQARPVESLYRDGRFPVGLPTGRSSSRASLRNSTPAHFHFCLKASGSDGVGGLFN